MAIIAASDFLVLLSHGVLYYFWLQNNVPYTVCKIGTFVFYFSLHLSVALLVAMTMEKWIGIKYPLQSAVWITRYGIIFSSKLFSYVKDTC